MAIGDSVKGAELIESCSEIPGLIEICRNSLDTSENEALASTLEFALEGLHLSGKIGKLNNSYS